MNFNDLMKFNKEKWKANAPGRKQCQASAHPVDHPFGKQLVRKGAQGPGGHQVEHEPAVLSLAEKANSVLGCTGRNAASR